MRLLNTRTRLLRDYSTTLIPKYAILSHTWSIPEDEALFTDFVRDVADQMTEYRKIRFACDQAVKDGYEWIWIDTCCMNKDSSAELSEAINSMYRWYRDATACYAYLADVAAETDFTSHMVEFASSRWFKRGRTLQELIAPSSLGFSHRTGP